MLDRLEIRAQRNRKLFLCLTWFFLLLVAVFSIWLVWTFRAAVQFRDSLIDREYEGSLSTHLGFLVALTSEASRSKGPLSAAEERQSDELRTQLQAIQGRLSNLQPLASATWGSEEPFRLEGIVDTPALLQLLSDPRLRKLSFEELGLRLGASADFPDYSFLESSEVAGGAASFVFIPASSVETDGTTAGLSLKRRRELVFSKIAEHELRPLLTQTSERGISQAYYISCSDFARFVFPRPRTNLNPYREFWPLRSFVDRTYFRGAQAAKDGMRVSEPYLDVTGGGFVRTYSAFVNNRALGLCGMLALDLDQQPLQSFWQEVSIGTKTGGLRDFTFGTYSTPSGEIEPRSSFSKSLHSALAARLAAKEQDYLGGIQRLTVGDTKIFTVPMGEEKVGIFVFDAKAMRNKYFSILAAGFFAIVSFVVMVSLSAKGHRAAAEAEKRQIEILENLHGGFVIVDKRGSIIEANRRFQEMVGGGSHHNTIEGFLSPESAAEYRKLSVDKGFEFAGTLFSPERGTEPVIIAGAPLSFPGRKDSWMLILIPSRDLEQTIAKKFLNIFSHALKSPVHSILLITDLFRRRNALPRFDDYFSKLQRKVEEFRDLTDNVLRFSAIDVKEIHVNWESVNVAQVLRRVLSAVRERAQAKGLALRESIPDSLRVRADEQLLQVVLNNLIDNALKYTPSGRIAVLAIDLLTEIEVVVEDSGRGVPEAERDRIFELFVQGSEITSATHEGLGLGLYVSRQYVEAMGGTLRYQPVFKDEVASRSDEALGGSRFVLRFPKSARGFVSGEENGPEDADPATGG